MLAPADRELLARDRQIPGLRLALDGDALRDWLADRAPGVLDGDAAVRVCYLRYKPGTSVAAGCLLRDAEGWRPAYLLAWAPRSAGKLRAWGRPPPTGDPRSAVVLDADRYAVLGAPETDRRLPGVRSLRRGALTGGVPASVTVLRYKPRRRWVARLGPGYGGGGERPAVARVYRPAAAARHERTYRCLAGLPVSSPAVLGADPAAGFLLLEWVDGVLATERPPAPGELAAALARLHAAAPPDRWRRADVAAEAAVGAATVAQLVPGLAGRAGSLARQALAGLDPGADPAGLVHGDLSAEQVVCARTGLRLIDLDRVRVDDPVADLAGWVAAEVARWVAGGGAGPVAEAVGPVAEAVGAAVARWVPAYEAASGRRVAPRMGPRTALALLARAPDGFRARRPDWDGELDRLLRAAEAALAG